MGGVAATGFQTTRTLVRTPWTFMVFRTNPTPSHVWFGTSAAPPDAARCGVHELKKAGNQMKEQAASHTGYVANQSKEAAGRGAGVAENIAEKAKQTAQDAWEAARDGAQKVKATVAGKAEASADAVKENIDAVKRSMNTKN